MEVKDNAVESLKEMEAEHHKFVRQLFEEENKLLLLLGRPGNIDMEMITPLIESYCNISKKSASNKAHHIIKIRELLGREKSLYLISEMKKDFIKRMPKDRPQD